MRKTLLLALLLLVLTGCGQTAVPASVPESIPESVPVNLGDALEEFRRNAEPDWNILSSIATPGGISSWVVLFTEEGGSKTQLAYLEADGHFALCGVEAPPASPLGLAQAGEDAVTFRVLAGDGSLLDCRITASRSGGDLNFTVETAPASDRGQDGTKRPGD